jgi:hypothetical protein
MVTKEHILSEIKRTAKENGGKPLGMKGFETATGIRIIDWKGKFWVRWSEAVRDAGHTPNLLSTPSENSIVLERYAEYTHRLGHLPVEAELLLERRRDITFPAKNAFMRFGTKAELLKSVEHYCRTRDVYNDVVRFCEEYIPCVNKAFDKNFESPSDNIGFVYLIKSGQYYKIGKAKDADYRIGAIRLQLPEKAKRIHTIKTDDPSGIEAYWHKRFESKRKNGEWFDLDSTDVAAFKRRKFM